MRFYNRVLRCQRFYLSSTTLAENDVKVERRSTFLMPGEDEATLYVHVSVFFLLVIVLVIRKTIREVNEP